MTASLDKSCLRELCKIIPELFSKPLLILSVKYAKNMKSRSVSIIEVSLSYYLLLFTTLICLSIRTPKTINFPSVPNGKLIVLGVQRSKSIGFNVYRRDFSCI